VRVLLICDEELTLIRIGSRIWHGDNSLKKKKVVRNKKKKNRGIVLTLEVCRKAVLISSLKGWPQILSPPLPVPVGSPICTMNPLTFRKILVSLYVPFAHRARKFYIK
jgi:hypothetical protein